MSKGLGKIERWLLTIAYRKIVKRQLPDGWLQLKGERSKTRLYRSEVMLNYFGLERLPPDNSYLRRRNPQHIFKMTNKSKVVWVTCGRSIQSLVTKGYVEMRHNIWWNPDPKAEFCVNGTWLILTETGKVKAEELLNVNP